MLKQMRSQAKKLKFVLWLVIASFLASFVWLIQGGGGNAGDGGAKDFAAKVDDRVITVGEFQAALGRHDQRLRQEFGASYSPELLNAPRVLDSLVDRKVLLEEADRMGILVTPGQVATAVRTMGGVLDETGRFDRARYEELLQINGLRPAEFEAQVGDDLRIQQLDDIVTGGVAITQKELWDGWALDNDIVQIEYTIIPDSEFEAQVTVTEEEMRAHFDSHLADFDAGEGRKVRWVEFSREAFQKALENEAEMRKYYDENVDAIYTMTEDQRRASLILVKTSKDDHEFLRKKARARVVRAMDSAVAGTDFAVLAGGWSDDLATNDRGGDLGPFYRGSLEPEVEEAVFAAEEGAIVGPITTSRGIEILKVTKGPGRKARPYEEVKELVARGLYARQAAENLQAAVKKFQDSLASSPDFDAAAAAAGVEVQEAAWLTRDGVLPGLEANPLLGTEALRLDVGATSEPLAVAEGQVILNVLEKRSTSSRTFEEARAAVETAVRRVKQRSLARAEAEKLRAVALLEETLQRAIGDRPMKTGVQLRRGMTVPELGEAPDVVAAAFETRTGEFGRIADAPDGAMLFFVNSHRRPEQARFDEERESFEPALRQQRSDALRRDLLARLRKTYEDRITINANILAPFEKPQGG